MITVKGKRSKNPPKLIIGTDPPPRYHCVCGMTFPQPVDDAHLKTCAAYNKHDPVNHPKHYTAHPSGIECIRIVEHMTFNLGNVIKYIWRAGEKGPAETDLRKAIWYIEREIKRLASR